LLLFFFNNNHSITIIRRHIPQQFITDILMLS